MAARRRRTPAGGTAARGERFMYAVGRQGHDNLLPMNDCCLCSQIAGRAEHDLIARLLPGQLYRRRVMFESGAFAAVPSLGPLAPGHALLCPKAHVRSFAALDAAEWLAARDAFRAALAQRFGAEVHLFEHGMAPGGDRIVCTVDHAHLHFLPLPSGFDAGVGSWPECDPAELAARTNGREYVYYEAPGGTARLLVAEEGQPIESQYMRKLVAAGLGRAAHWNWRTDPDARAADRTWRRFVSP